MQKISDAELKQREHLRRQGVKEGRVLIGPRTLTMHVTGSCNLACRYCYYHSPASPSGQGGSSQIGFAKFRQIVRDCVALRVDELILSGEGEPTVYPRFYELMRWMGSLPIRVSIFTNGTFSAIHCRDMVMADRLVINVGAVTEAQYRLVHGKDLFLRVVDNIRQLAELRRVYNPGLRIEIVFIDNKLNHAAVSAAEAFFRKLGADVVNLVEAEIYDFTRDIAIPEARTHQPAGKGRAIPCLCWWYKLIVRPDLKLNVCCYRQQPIIADLSDRSLKTVWGSTGLNKLRLAGLRGAGCEDCVIYTPKGQADLLKGAAFHDAPSVQTA